MTAIATVIYMVFPEINIVPGVSHLKVDFSDFPAILTGVIIGPVQGILVEVFKNIIHLTRTTTVGIGEIMNIILGSSMILSMWGFVKLFKKIFNENKISVKTTEIFVYLIPVSSFSCFLLRVISAVTASRALTVPLITP